MVVVAVVEELASFVVVADLVEAEVVAGVEAGVGVVAKFVAVVEEQPLVVVVVVLAILVVVELVVVVAAIVEQVVASLEIEVEGSLVGELAS